MRVAVVDCGDTNIDVSGQSTVPINGQFVDVFLTEEVIPQLRQLVG